MKRFCAMCGKEFEATSAAVRYCDECKVEVKKNWQEKQKQYAKNRAAKLGLVNITVYKDERDMLKTLASKENTTVAEVIKKLVANIETELTIDEPKDEPKDEPIETTPKKATKKATKKEKA